MTTRKVSLIGYEDALGHQMVDHATGDILRGPMPMLTNDYGRFSMVSVVDNTIVTCDYYNTINIFDLDMVHRITIANGRTHSTYTDGQFNPVHIHNGQIYHIVKVGNIAGVPQPDNYRIIILKYSLVGTLLETITLDPQLYDEVGNNSYVFDGEYNRGSKWVAGNLWMVANDGALVGQYVKISLSTGLVTDSFLHGMISAWQGVIHCIESNGLIWLDTDGVSAFNGYLVDFTAKTATPFTSPSPANVEINYLRSRQHQGWASLVSQELKILVTSADGFTAITSNWSGTPSHTSIPFVANKLGAPIVTPITSLQNAAFTADGNEVMFYSMDGGYGVFNVNTGAIPWHRSMVSMFPGEDIGVTCHSITPMELPEYTVQGTVTDDGTPAVRNLNMFDQGSKSLLSITASTGGDYSLPCFTVDTKMVVCESLDDSQNFQVNAHLIPVA